MTDPLQTARECGIAYNETAQGEIVLVATPDQLAAFVSRVSAPDGWREGYECGRKGGINAPVLHPDTAFLVTRFSDALRRKLADAEKKYGYSDGWASNDWMDECRAKLLEHIAKGDPRDVAAYCAFLWHHGESTAPPAPAAKD